MKIATNGKYLIILCTAPTMQSARTIAKALIEKHLVACANLVPSVESIYRWEGKIEESTEVLLLMKTSLAKHEAALEALQSLHPYDTPEGLAVPVIAGLERYLDWIDDSLKSECDSLG